MSSSKKMAVTQIQECQVVLVKTSLAVLAIVHNDRALDENRGVVFLC